MNAKDMIFNEVYKGSLREGASERAAKDCAVQACVDYGRSNYKKIDQLIKDAIKKAKKL